MEGMRDMTKLANHRLASLHRWWLDNGLGAYAGIPIKEDLQRLNSSSFLRLQRIRPTAHWWRHTVLAPPLPRVTDCVQIPRYLSPQRLLSNMVQWNISLAPGNGKWYLPSPPSAVTTTKIKMQGYADDDYLYFLLLNDRPRGTIDKVMLISLMLILKHKLYPTGSPRDWYIIILHVYNISVHSCKITSVQ